VMVAGEDVATADRKRKTVRTVVRDMWFCFVQVFLCLVWENLLSSGKK
jgi:hypothetical protein